MIINTMADHRAQAKRMLDVIKPLSNCLGSDPDIFFDETIEGRKHAKSICASCGVRSKCLDYALKYERYGSWGGTDEKERMQLRKRLGIRLVDIYVRQQHEVHA